MRNCDVKAFMTILPKYRHNAIIVNNNNNNDLVCDQQWWKPNGTEPNGF